MECVHVVVVVVVGLHGFRLKGEKLSWAVGGWGGGRRTVKVGRVKLWATGLVLAILGL